MNVRAPHFFCPAEAWKVEVRMRIGSACCAVTLAAAVSASYTYGGVDETLKALKDKSDDRELLRKRGVT